MAESSAIERIIEANPDIKSKVPELRKFVSNLKTVMSCGFFVCENPEAGEGFRYYLLDEINSKGESFTPVPSADILRMVAGDAAHYMMAMVKIFEDILAKTEDKD
jgi:hypothetical protein